MKLFKKLSVILGVVCFYIAAVNFAVIAGVATFSGKVKSVDTSTGKFVLTTDSGDVTLNTDEKTKVNITDVEGAKTKADVGSLQTIDKDGADKADSADVTADESSMVAKNVDATTSRRMTLTKEEIAAKAEQLIAGNFEVARKVQLASDSVGTINGKVRVMARTSEDVVIYIKEINGNSFTPAAKTQVADGAENVKIKTAGSGAEFPMMDQVNIAFTPHVLPVLTGSVVDFPNSDTVRHNVFSPDPIPGTEEKINLGTYDVGTIKTVNLAADGELPLLCNVHAEMSGYIVAVPNPYFTLTDRKGAFTIENVPAGKYVLTTWHERFKPVELEVEVAAGAAVEVKLPTMKNKK